MKRFSARYKVTCSWADDRISTRLVSSDNFESAFEKALDMKRDFSSDLKVELISLEEDD